MIKSKVIRRKHHIIEERQFYLELAELLVGDKEKMLTLKKRIDVELD